MQPPTQAGSRERSCWTRSGFVLTGPAADGSHGLFETRRQGVSAVGDVRSGSVKRVASAVGEGSVAIRQVHEFLEAEGRR